MEEFYAEIWKMCQQRWSFLDSYDFIFPPFEAESQNLARNCS
jgi:hypothetical protein